MQTFLPYVDYDWSAICLDPSRLGNQAYREVATLIKGGWKHHPASKMWQGHFHSLADYALACLLELSRRGREYPHHIAMFEAAKGAFPDTGPPPWLGDERLHASHRSALLFKNPIWYNQFGWWDEPAVPDENGSLPYYWPVK